MTSPKTPIRMRSAADLFAGLRHSELSVRLPTLGAVAAQPDLVLAYGPHEGVDIVEELCAQLAREPGLCGPALLGALVCFRDERVLIHCGEIARHSQERELVALATERLGREPGPPSVILRELLWLDEPWRAQLSAQALDSHPTLPAGDRVRTELWGGVPHPDNLQPASRPHWLKELQGPLRARARRCLEEQGLTAFQWLLQEQAPDEWLLRWGAARFPREVEALLRKELEGHQCGLVLELLEQHSSDFPELLPLSQPFQKHPDPAWRARAWRLAMQPPAQELFQLEVDPDVRLAMAEHWVSPTAPLELLVGLAQDPDWRLRAVAARGLTALQALESARTLALSPLLPSRTVGATVLVALEDYEWMEDHLLG